MWTLHHLAIFLLTFISYAFFHATRKTFSNVKTTISQEWTPAVPKHTNHSETIVSPAYLWTHNHMFETSKEAETYLGILDAVFMSSYAVGLFISGMIGDRFDMRKVLSLGMCSAAVSVFVFGNVFEWTHFYNKYVYVLVWILNGLLQSTGWPTVVAVMGNWFGRSSKKAGSPSCNSRTSYKTYLAVCVMPWVCAWAVECLCVCRKHYRALLVSAVLDYGYEYAFLLTSSVLFAGGVIMFFGLVPSPKDIGLPAPDNEPKSEDVTIVNPSADMYSAGNRRVNQQEIEEEEIEESDPLLPHSDEGEADDQSPERHEALSFFKALCLPGVILYSLSYFCLKLVNYSFFFWLPFYLHAAFGWAETVADEISIWYDVGGIIGGTIGGVISDIIKRRSIVVIPMLVLGIPMLFIYSNSPNDHVINGVLMAFTGFFIGGVANLVSAAISADLGRQGPIQGNKEALATVTGIVDGTGSVGAALGQILVPIIQERTADWHFVFYLFMLMTLATICCILPMFIREFPLFIRDIRESCGGCSYSWFGGLRYSRPNRPSSIQAEDSNEDTDA